MSRIVHVTTVHKRKDIRIFQKELRSLSREFPDITLVVNDGLGDETVDGIRIVDLRVSYKTRLGRFFRPFRRLLSLMKELRPDIVHFHDPELIPFGLTMAFKGYPVIYDIHEDYPKLMVDKPWIAPALRKLVSSLFSSLEKFAVSRFAAVALVNESQVERLGKKKHAILHNYSVIGQYTENEVAPPEDYFMYIGVLLESRGLQEMLDALALLPDQYSLVVAGLLSPSARAIAEAHPAWNKVRDMGWMETEALITTTRKAIAGLMIPHPLPNIIDSSPNKLFEYMASGIPVVSSDFPGFRKIVEGSQCGILVPAHDHKAAYDAMLYLANNPQERIRMGLNGMRAVREQYNWEKESEKLLALYHDILSTKDNTIIDKEATA